MVDKHLMDQMESILSRLSIPVMLADKDPEAQMAGNELPLVRSWKRWPMNISCRRS